MSAPEVHDGRLAELDAHLLHDLLKLRSDVFLVEQGIVAEPDLDGRDRDALLLWIRGPDGAVLATARVLDGRAPWKVERVAVRRDVRGRGLGTRLMGRVHELLAGTAGTMSAQVDAVGFYENLGWRATGPRYDEAGVPHRRLEWPP